MKTTQSSPIRNIVCIDDNETDYFIFRKQLKLYGSLANIWYYSNPVEALKDLWERLPQIEPDLFLVDYNMSEMNGIDCIKDIQKIMKNIYSEKEVRIVLYSSTGFEQFVRNLNELKVGFIEKPISKYDIESLLAERTSVSEFSEIYLQD